MMIISEPDNINKSNDSKESLYQVTKQWINKIICKPPLGEKENAYIIDTRTNSKIKYIEADCDSLRHNITNYEHLLERIKTQYKEELYKEAILNTIKYEATRQAFRQQHQWIHNVYQAKIIEVRAKNFNQQMASDIKQLEAEVKNQEQIIAKHKQELEQLKEDCKKIAVGAYQELQVQYKQLQKDFEKEKKRCEELGKNNQRLGGSIGGYKGNYTKEKKKNEALKSENIALKNEISILTTENINLKAELEILKTNYSNELERINRG